MTKTLSEIAEGMRDIDFTMLTTHGPDNTIAARPMSNNREVDYDGDSYYFTWDSSLMVADIARDPRVALTFQGKAGLLGMRPFFVAVEGEADVIRDKARFAEHWSKGLDRWFEQGVDTPGLAMLHVRATRIHYWDGEDEGEVKLAAVPA
ncbi:pyridoxamine 5'-phosphate oxidase family protein [Sphingomonas bacterium]|uniref:pyridoxamine 5'-phosphate oxidase family protein n=1 Tax=Sphingomonas bacterium TaxID=1895847 RepID=UPI002631F794|nr:pyridoxamine 5'-phosphate oxidase family protein [Sphingomonas bacterium]MDB5678801.1 pyridoxamine 5-phosphate oxidase [Sphingomonas bacterium]